MKLRSLFLEEVPVKEEKNEIYDEGHEEETIEVELEEVNSDTLIEDIYLQNNLIDREKSIFKVEELINSLPKEMVTDVKKAAVLSILKSFGLMVTDVCGDAENRICVLNAAIKKITDENDAEIATNEEKIEDCKKQIAELEQAISSAKEESRFSSETINSELRRIEDLVKFVGGEN